MFDALLRPLALSSVDPVWYRWLTAHKTNSHKFMLRLSNMKAHASNATTNKYPNITFNRNQPVNSIF